MKLIKIVALVIATLLLSLLLFLSSAIVPNYYAPTHDADPFFDLVKGKVVLTNPTVQIISIASALLSPLLASLLSYFITEQKRSILTYLPILLMYPLYILLIYYRLTGVLKF